MNNIKISTLIVAAFAAAISPLSSTEVFGQEVTNQRLIVTFQDRVEEQDLSGLKNNGATIVKRLDLVNGIVVNVPSQAVAGKLKSLDNVERVEVDAIATTFARPQQEVTPIVQPAQTTPWGVQRIDAPKSWITSRGTGVKVAVIDTGVDKTHPDLVDNIAGGVNFITSGRGANAIVDPAAWNDDNGHGTHVSGTIAAADNAIGVIGVAPQARLYGVKVLNSAGNGYVSDIISGVEWSVKNNMQVLNLSLGLGTHVQALQDAVNAADAAGVIVVAASGNSGDGNASTNNVNYPAKYSSAIAVSATDSIDRIATFSSDGQEVAVAGPGVSVYSTTRGGSYSYLSGTSMATPHVAGVVANMLAAPVHPAADSNQDGLWSASEVRAYLLASSDDLGSTGHDVFYGYGLVDNEEAVTGQQNQ